MQGIDYSVGERVGTMITGSPAARWRLEPSMPGPRRVHCKYRVDDAGLEPATSALSRRRSPS